MRTLFLIFVLTTNPAFGQTIEQKALTYLADTIYGQYLTNSQESFMVTKGSTRIWFYPFVYETKSKLKIKNGTRSSEDNFYKIVHSDKDIFVTTKKAITTDGVLFVPFDISTKYGIHFFYKVMFVKDEPVKLFRISN
jgi:hypothetical protein